MGSIYLAKSFAPYRVTSTVMAPNTSEYIRHKNQSRVCVFALTPAKMARPRNSGSTFYRISLLYMSTVGRVVSLVLEKCHKKYQDWAFKWFVAK